MDLKQIAVGWIGYWRARETLDDVTGLDETEALEDLVREDQELALGVILEILSRIEASPETMLFQVLAAGPVEDLLVHHGPTIIDRLEMHASRDERFNLLLGGVWQSTIAPDVWARVEKVRRNVW